MTFFERLVMSRLCYYTDVSEARMRSWARTLMSRSRRSLWSSSSSLNASKAHKIVSRDAKVADVSETAMVDARRRGRMAGMDSPRRARGIVMPIIRRVRDLLCGKYK